MPRRVGVERSGPGAFFQKRLEVKPLHRSGFKAPPTPNCPCPPPGRPADFAFDMAGLLFMLRALPYGRLYS